MNNAAADDVCQIGTQLTDTDAEYIMSLMKRDPWKNCSIVVQLCIKHLKKKASEVSHANS